MGATSLAPCDCLRAGEVGYLTASIKTVRGHPGRRHRNAGLQPDP